MNEPTLSLSYDALLRRGAPPSAGLRDWLQRASRFAQAFHPQERAAYVAWAAEAALRFAQSGNPAWSSLDLAGPRTAVPPSSPSSSVLPPHEADRHQRLLHACLERVGLIYGADATSLKLVQDAVRRELQAVAQRVLRGELSFFAVGSETVVARVLHPHPLPPLPPQLVSRVVAPQPIPPPPIATPPPPPPPIPSGHRTSLSATLPNFGKVTLHQATLAEDPRRSMHERPRSPPSFREATTQPHRAQPQPPAYHPGANVAPPLSNYRAGPASSSDANMNSRAFAAITKSINERLGVFFPHHARATTTLHRAPYHSVVGSSTALERRYTREEPKPEDLRPRSQLPAALSHALNKAALIACGNAEVLATSKAILGQHPAWEGARWLSDQLKGMRQDVQVQHIADAFAVALYERHARVCLSLGDGLEFNQCQSALQRFYSRGLRSEPTSSSSIAATPAPTAAKASGKAKKNGKPQQQQQQQEHKLVNPLERWTREDAGQRGDEAVVEFTACRLLYLSLNGLYDTSARECQSLASSPTALRDHPCVLWAMDLSAALEARDGHLVCDKLQHMLTDETLERTLALSVVGLLAPVLQRLRVQWLTSALHRGALKSNMTVACLRSWLGFPMLDDMCAERVIGNVLVGPGHPSATAAWDGLWKTTLKLPVDAVGPLDSSHAAKVDLNVLSTHVLQYTNFLNSSSSGGV